MVLSLSATFEVGVLAQRAQLVRPIGARTRRAVRELGSCVLNYD